MLLQGIERLGAEVGEVPVIAHNPRKRWNCPRDDIGWMGVKAQ
jgi:hypothetical protein